MNKNIYMQKGITPVIAVILLLLITISLVGFAFVFLGRTTETAAESGEQQLEQQISQINARFVIENVDAGKVYIRNLGTETIPANALAVYVDDKKVNYTIASDISSNEVEEIVIISKSCKDLAGGRIRVSAGVASDSAALNQGDGIYTVYPSGSPIDVYCDMTTDGGGWTLVYIMCQDGGGDARSSGLRHTTPITPTKRSPVSSISYSTVSSMNLGEIRFTSDFTDNVGYKFTWGTITGGINSAQILLDGLMPSQINVCQSLGTPISGSTGVSCNMQMEHNNPGSETNDIPTLGCSCSVWGGDGMLWGQIDSLSNYNGASHLDTIGWDHSPQTSDGCILTYVR